MKRKYGTFSTLPAKYRTSLDTARDHIARSCSCRRNDHPLLISKIDPWWTCGTMVQQAIQVLSSPISPREKLRKQIHMHDNCTDNTRSYRTNTSTTYGRGCASFCLRKGCIFSLQLLGPLKTPLGLPMNRVYPYDSSIVHLTTKDKHGPGTVECLQQQDQSQQLYPVNQISTLCFFAFVSSSAFPCWC